MTCLRFSCRRDASGSRLRGRRPHLITISACEGSSAVQSTVTGRYAGVPPIATDTLHSLAVACSVCGWPALRACMQFHQHDVKACMHTQLFDAALHAGIAFLSMHAILLGPRDFLSCELLHSVSIG